MSTVGAWLLDFGSGRTAVIGERQMLHLLPMPLSLHRVPASPVFCRHVVVWEQEPIPVMDLPAWLEDRPPREEPAVVAIAAFSAGATAENRRGAFMLSAIPRRIMVSDAQACELPAELAGWREIALSCILHDERPVPVLHLSHVFSGALSRQVVPSNLAEAFPAETRATV